MMYSRKNTDEDGNNASNPRPEQALLIYRNAIGNDGICNE